MASARLRLSVVGARKYLPKDGYYSDSGMERSDSLSSEDDLFQEDSVILNKMKQELNDGRDHRKQFTRQSLSSSSDDGFESERMGTEKESEESNREIYLLPGLSGSSWNWLKDPEYFVDGSRRIRRDIADIHYLTDSLFSTSSGFNNYRGLLNLCIVLLVLSNFRLAIENLIKYGILIDPFVFVEYLFRDPYHWPCIALLIAANVFINVCFFIELALSARNISERCGVLLHVMNLSATLIFPAGVILAVHPVPFMSSMTLGIYTCLFLKMISYACVNRWCREKLCAPKRRKTLSASSSDGYSQHSSINGVDKKYSVPLQEYPDNLNYKDLYYFVFCPTLCYELNFPRTARIRMRFLLKRVIEMLFLVQIIAALVQQWMIPTVMNSLEPFMNLDYTLMLTRIFKLAIPNHFIWLLSFYWFFHSCLNVVAELLMFGDREFYKDWWNCETVHGFWQNWNIPVHRWGKRHLYVPMLKAGFSRFQASLAVFLVSAFFHEYLVSIPLRMFKLWAFSGMLGQVPLAMLVSKFLDGKLGNIAVWLSLILGQPIAILMYVHDYYVLHM